MYSYLLADVHETCYFRSVNQIFAQFSSGNKHWCV